MPAVYEVRWLPDGPTEEYFGSRGNYYELSESDHIDVHAGLVWCHCCNAITEGEELSTVDEIERQISDLHDPTTELYQSTRYGLVEKLTKGGENYLRDRIEELQRRLRWRAARLSPPKCIVCGSTDIMPLPTGEPIPSPRGEGQIQVHVVGMCSTSFREWYFTPEGDRIPRETQPKYWTHPDPALNQPLTREMLEELVKSASGENQADSR